MTKTSKWVKKDRGKSFKELPKLEQAIILLADYMENPNHDQYKIKEHILNILGYESLT